MAVTSSETVFNLSIYCTFCFTFRTHTDDLSTSGPVVLQRSLAATKTRAMSQRFSLHLSLETAYGSLAFFTSVLHNVFLLYHVDMFVSVYKIDKMSFFLGEIVFLFWNCINDPLFGWLSDRHYLQGGGKEHPHSDVVTRRIVALQKNGPMLALAFLTFWVAWAYPWLQFLVCMCVYDGFLTMVDLHHSALLADLAVSNEERTRLNSRCSLFSIVGSASVFVSYLLWHREDLTRFRAFCGLLACVSLVGFVVMCRLMKSAYARQRRQELAAQDSTGMQSSERLVCCCFLNGFFFLGPKYYYYFSKMIRKITVQPAYFISSHGLVWNFQFQFQ